MTDGYRGVLRGSVMVSDADRLGDLIRGIGSLFVFFSPDRISPGDIRSIFA